MATDILTAEKKTVDDLTAQLKKDGSLSPEDQQRLDMAQQMYNLWTPADPNKPDTSGNGVGLILAQEIAQGALGAIAGGNSAGVETGALIIGSNLVAGQVEQTMKDAGFSVDPKNPATGFTNVVTQAVVTGLTAGFGTSTSISATNSWSPIKSPPDKTNGGDAKPGQASGSTTTTATSLDGAKP